MRYQPTRLFACLRTEPIRLGFKTPLKQGAGIAHVADGKIDGGDSFMTYSGTYDFIGDRFTAILQVTRHSEGPASVFGLDNFTLNLRGKLVGKIASFTAVADEVPNVVLEGTLIRSEVDVAVAANASRV